jgi:hypothetical protein
VNYSRPAIVKAAIAVLVGVPATLFLLPPVLYLICLGALSLWDKAHGRSGDVVNPGVMLLWAFSGLAGLGGFWFWVLSRPAASMRRRIITAVCVLIGVQAAAPLALAELSLLSWIVGLACAFGIVICLWLIIPRFPLNPDARQRKQRAD